MCRAEEVTRVFVLTCLEMSCERAGHGNIGRERRAYNAMVKEGADGASYGVVDVAGEIRYWRKVGEEAGEEAEVADDGEWYCDGLHLTRLGYKRVGEMMWEVLERKKTTEPT